MSLFLVSAIVFGFGFVGSMPLAGPIAVLMVSNGFRGHYGRALLLGVGASVAEAGYAFLAFFGFTALLARHAVVVPISHAVTAIVLLVVGAYFVRWRNPDETSVKPGDPAAKMERRHASSFMIGFTVCALNPTLLVTWSAATAALYSKGLTQPSALWAVAFGLAAGLGVATWDVVLVLLMRRYGARFPKRALVWIVRGMGMLLVALAIWSAVDLVGYLRAPAPVTLMR